jgi:hypothetical protein
MWLPCAPPTCRRCACSGPPSRRDQAPPGAFVGRLATPAGPVSVQVVAPRGPPEHPQRLHAVLPGPPRASPRAPLGASSWVPVTVHLVAPAGSLCRGPWSSHGGARLASPWGRPVPWPHALPRALAHAPPLGPVGRLVACAGSSCRGSSVTPTWSARAPGDGSRRVLTGAPTVPRPCCGLGPSPGSGGVVCLCRSWSSHGGRPSGPHRRACPCLGPVPPGDAPPRTRRRTLTGPCQVHVAAPRCSHRPRPCPPHLRTPNRRSPPIRQIIICRPSTAEYSLRYFIVWRLSIWIRGR